MDGTDIVDEVLLTPVEVRRWLGISASSFQRYVQKGALPIAGRTAFGHRRFRAGDAARASTRAGAGSSGTPRS